MDDAERLAALRLNLVSGIGPRLFSALVERFGSARAAAEAPSATLAEIRGIGPNSAPALHRAIAEAEPEAEFEKARAAGVRIVVRGEPDYPIALNYLTDAPPVLYVKGTLVPEDAQAIAIVGMRKCSLYGEEQAARLAGGLVRAGFTIVSGLARGIDSSAHKAALAAGGRTLAVQGRGLAEVYPPENKRLAEAVAERGALVSEFAMDIGPAAGELSAPQPHPGGPVAGRRRGRGRPAIGRAHHRAAGGRTRQGGLCRSEPRRCPRRRRLATP